MKIQKLILIFFLIGFSTFSSAKSISNQIIEDDLKVVIDYSAIINKQLVSEDICNVDYIPTKKNSVGTPVKMLGFANVYMGAGPGISKFGHSGERFVYCIGNQLHDIYYDGIKLTKETFSLFTTDYQNVSLEYTASDKANNSLYYRKIQNPTQMAVYGTDTVQLNRNIYEQWLDLSEEEILSLLIKNIDRRALQDKRVANNEKLAAFSGLLNNCTYQVTDDLLSVPSIQTWKIAYKYQDTNKKIITSQVYKSLSSTLHSVQPKTIFNSLTEAKLTKLLVIYPSQDKTREIFLKETSRDEAIKALEVPDFSFNPKYSLNWSEAELNQLQTELVNYQSPLASFFIKSIAQ